MTTVREFLTKFNQRKGYETDDEGLVETLIECSREVQRIPFSKHRWYHKELVVVDIEGTYIKFIDYLITGDSSMSDMDLRYDIDNAKIVQRKERQATQVYYE